MILIVDSDEGMRELLRDLMTEGFPNQELVLASDPDGVALEETPELIITGLIFKGSSCNGIEFIMRIRADHPQTKIILLTGSLQIPHNQAHALITKPFDSELLLRTVETLLSGN
ncbi:response regulator [Patescibacteria group bacterium]|nr:response regulator [Patescibacteria group bacterium]